jgi:hypothetical protein
VGGPNTDPSSPPVCPSLFNGECKVPPNSNAQACPSGKQFINGQCDTPLSDDAKAVLNQVSKTTSILTLPSVCGAGAVGYAGLGTPSGAPFSAAGYVYAGLDTDSFVVLGGILEAGSPNAQVAKEVSAGLLTGINVTTLVFFNFGPVSVMVDTQTGAIGAFAGMPFGIGAYATPAVRGTCGP